MTKGKIVFLCVLFIGVTSLSANLSPTQDIQDLLSSSTIINPRVAKATAGTGVAAANQTCTLIDFEGLADNTPIGTIEGPVNVHFGSSWLSLIDQDAGGHGNFANEPSPSTTAYFLDQNDISISFNIGVQLVEFYYVASSYSLPVVVTAFDDHDNMVSRMTGSKLGNSSQGANCSGDPNGSFCLFSLITLASTANNIFKISIEGTTSNQFGIDNLRICRGECTPIGPQAVQRDIDIACNCGPDNISECLLTTDFAGDHVADCLVSRIVADSGEKLELWCVSKLLTAWDVPGLAHYELHYFYPNGEHFKVGACRWIMGHNTGILYHSGDNDGNGKPDCFIRTVWKNYDQVGDDWTDDDLDGMKDWWVFTFDVANNNLSKVQYHSIDGPWGPEPDIVVTNREDPPLGPESEAFFNNLIAQFEQNTTSGQGPMGKVQIKRNDLNGDGRVDVNDINYFDSMINTWEGQANFRPVADVDGDGCITVVDRDYLFPPKIDVKIDIKPGSCPNSVNPKNTGKIAVAILGTGDFDVSTIEPCSVRLAGEPPLSAYIEDVSTPAAEGSCNCNLLGEDSFPDLVLFFQMQDVSKAANLRAYVGQTVPIQLTGELKKKYGKFAIEGTDCVIVLKK
jgi:hypothetical protein